MTVWRDRSSIVAAMLNPALVTALLATAAKGHRRETERGMPWSLSFVVAPLVLHRATREALPRSTRTHLASWVGQHPVERAGFPGRAAALVGHVREGLRFGLSHGALVMEGDRLESVYTRPSGFQMPRELDVLLRKADLTGRWLSKTDSPATVFTLLGVAP